MYKRWSDTPVCWLCDYGWTLLLALALLLTGYLTRGYWLPLLGVTPPAPTPTALPVPTSTPAQTITPASATATVTPTSEFYGYVNDEGGYAFNYPAQWKGKAAGTDAYFQLPNNAKLEIVVRALQAGETLESLADDTGPLTIPKSNLTNLTVGGEPALQYDVLDARSEIVTRTYQVLHTGRAYYLTLFAPLEAGTVSFSQSLEQFDQLMLDFQFLP